MLILSRKLGEQVRIGGNIIVIVTRIDRDVVKLAFHAPAGVTIDREEIHQLKPPCSPTRTKSGPGNVPSAASPE